MNTSAPIIFKYLSEMNERKSSDLYLTVGVPPTLRGETGLVETGLHGGYRVPGCWGGIEKVQQIVIKLRVFHDAPD